MSPKVSAEYMRARRSEILEAATTVFSEKGFHAATLDEVAEAAGVSKGSIYNYFDSKESIIDALSEQWQTVDDETFDSADRRRRPVDGLSHVANTTIRRMQREDFNDSVRLGLFLWAEILVNPAVQKSQMKLVEEWRRRVHSLVAAGQEAGEIDPRHDALAITTFLGSLMVGLYMSEAWKIRSERAALEQLIDSFLRGLRPGDG